MGPEKDLDRLFNSADISNSAAQEGPNMEIANQVRGYAFVLTVLRGQQADPYCRGCNSFVKVLAAAREGIAGLEAGNRAGIDGLPEELARLFNETKKGLTALCAPEQPVGQKKAGNCKLPQGVCFLKSSLALIQTI
jgi:hypothetical protein